MDSLILLSILFIIVISWQSAQKAKEAVIPICRRCCKQMQLQLLDDTVALYRLRLVRSQSGWLTWHRTYCFEFSSAEIERQKGYIVYRENRVESIQIQDENGRIFSSPDES